MYETFMTINLPFSIFIITYSYPFVLTLPFSSVHSDPLMFNDFFSILEFVIYRRKSSLENQNQKLNQLINEQHTDGNAENHDGEMHTLPMGQNKNTTYQGMKTHIPKFVKK